MKKKIRNATLAAALTAVSFWGTGSALVSASTVHPASGLAVRTSVVLTEAPQAAGPNMIFSTYETGTLSGTVSGSFAQNLTVLAYADGSLEIHGSGVITGTVGRCGGGAAGTIPYDITGRFNPATGIEISFVSRDQGANTLGVHLDLDIVNGPYTGTYSCDGE